jgi:hypothetical protein
MGCGCGGSVNEWVPVTAEEARRAEGELASDANERIQQARREQQAAQHWGPGTWDGNRRVAAEQR